MRVAVMGSGGVGGYFGARLAKGGAEVAFVARGAHLAAMRAQGLAVTGPDAFQLPRVTATDDPATIGVVDLVIFAVKLWDTEAALAQIKSVVGPDTVVISFQNGVLKDEMLAKAFGPERIMGGVCYVATSIAQAGVIARIGPLERLVFGELGGRATPRAKRILEAFRAGGVNAELSLDIRREIWQKFVFLVALSGSTTTMRSSIGPIRKNPQTRQFFLDLMREVIAVGRAHGVDLPEDYAEQQLALADRVAPDMTSSMHHDLERGNRLEVRWLAGAVAELGRARNVATPLNRAVADILALREAGSAA
jgi:2-dehydropantoate 2-reductase